MKCQLPYEATSSRAGVHPRRLAACGSITVNRELRLRPKREGKKSGNCAQHSVVMAFNADGLQFSLAGILLLLQHMWVVGE